MVDVVIGAAVYDGYADQSTADAFLAADFARATAWAALTNDQKGQALVSATRRLDRLKWLGEKTSAVQPLQWPRTGTVDCDGVAVPDSTVPIAIIHATILLAADITAKSSLEDDTSTATNIKRVRAGRVEIEFFSGQQQGLILSKHLFELVSCFLGGSDVLGFAVAFGTDVVSGLDDYGRTEGFA